MIQAVDSALFRRLAGIPAGLLILCALAGCATYQNKVGKAREMMTEGKTDEAIQKLEPLAKTPGGDQLVYMLDYATALQIAGRYEDSNLAYLTADKLADVEDYHSVSRVTGSMLSGEEMIQYKGDTFEKIFINAQLAMNYLQVGKLDDALVECRRINDKYQKLKTENKKNFELNPYAKYLSAVIWEADHRYDDAIIAYEEAYKISPDIHGLKEDLIRTSKLSHRMDDYKDWKAKFPEVQEKPQWYDKKGGELVVIVEQGWGPRKAFDPYDNRWPVLRPVFNQTQRVVVNVENGPSVETGLVYDVQDASIKTLADDRASLIARRMAAMVAKDVAAEQLRKKNELLGVAAWIAMRASDRADLRQWSTLPQTVQFARIFLPAGEYKYGLQGLTVSGQPSADERARQSVVIRPGSKAFVFWRAMH